MSQRNWRREREQAAAQRVATDARATFVRMRESPDAHLRAGDGRNVGLEVVSVVDQEVLDARRRMIETTEVIEQDLITRGFAGHMTLGFALESFDAQAGAALRRQLAKFDLGRLSTQPRGELNEDQLRAAGIEGVAWLSWCQSSKPGAGWGYRRRTSAGGTLVDICLAKKHAKLRRYREQAQGEFDSYWLAIDSLGAGTAEDGGFTMLLARSYETLFDRVFLLVRGSTMFERAEDVTPLGQVAKDG